MTNDPAHEPHPVFANQPHIHHLQYGPYWLPIKTKDDDDGCLHPLPPPSAAETPESQSTTGESNSDNGHTAADRPSSSSQTLFLCQFCFDYFPTFERRDQHEREICRYQSVLPGKCVYKDAKRTIHQVSVSTSVGVGGSTSSLLNQLELSVEDEIELLDKRLLQNLCLLAKCFIQHKTLYYHIPSFTFYLLYSSENHELLGFFNREILDPVFTAGRQCLPSVYALNTCLVLPQYQRQGHGRFLVEFSHMLARIWPAQHNSPERPLSAAMHRIYLQFWRDLLLEYLSAYFASQSTDSSTSETTGRPLRRSSNPQSVPNLCTTVQDLADRLFMDPEDLVECLADFSGPSSTSPLTHPPSPISPPTDQPFTVTFVDQERTLNHQTVFDIQFRSIVPSIQESMQRRTKSKKWLVDPKCVKYEAILQLLHVRGITPGQR